MTRSLRIAFFVHEFPALSETFVLNQVTGLLDLGHDVTIFAVRPRAESIVHEDVERYGLRARTRYLDMPAKVAERIAKGAASIFRHVWRRPRTTLSALDVPRYGHDASSFRLLFWAQTLRNEQPFDIIHCHFGPIGQLAAKLRDIGAISGHLVTVFHGVDISAYVRNDRNYYRFLFSVGDLFLPISNAWSRKLIDLGCDPAQIDIHHMGIDLDRYAFRERRHESDAPVRFLTVGRMVEKKGIEYGLKAVAELARNDVDLEYTIVGDGPLRGELEDFVEREGLQGHVRFLGWQEQSAIAQLMGENDILLAPSVTSIDGDQEGIPVTLMEAMAAGMLAVSTYHSGIPELIEHTQSGFLVPERDVSALAWVLMQLARSPALWPAMSAAAHEKVAREFAIAGLNRRLVQRYEALIEGRPKSRPRNRMFIARRRFATN